MTKKKNQTEASFEYLVVDEELSEDFGILYQGPDEEKARIIFKRWFDRRSIKLKRRQVSEYEDVPIEEKPFIPPL